MGNMGQLRFSESTVAPCYPRCDKPGYPVFPLLKLRYRNVFNVYEEIASTYRRIVVI